jgi:hypothetical protein
MGNEVVVITVRTFDQPDVVFAGARIPVSRIGSFPVRFKMTEKNVIQSPSSTSSARLVWTQAMTSNDLVVEAVVCQTDTMLPDGTIDVNATPSMCRSTEGAIPMRATGLAKLVRLQNNEDDSVTFIRAPVALPLE